MEGKQLSRLVWWSTDSERLRVGIAAATYQITLAHARYSLYTLQWSGDARPPTKIKLPLPLGGSGPTHITWFLEQLSPPESILWSVHSFLYGSRLCPTDRQTDRPRYTTVTISRICTVCMRCGLMPCFLPSVLWHCWLGVRKSIQPVKTEWWGVGVDRVVIWSEVQIVCIRSSWWHCHPKTQSSLASFKSRLVLPVWYWLTQFLLEKRPLNGCSSISTPCFIKSGPLYIFSITFYLVGQFQ